MAAPFCCGLSSELCSIEVRKRTAPYGIVAGARGDADADGVRLEFLRAREAGERKLRLGERQRAHFRIADHVADDAADQRRLFRLLFADRGVAGDDVAHLVRQHRRQLGFVVGERDQPAGHVKLAGRQGEGVDRLRIEHGDLVVQVGPLRRRHQAFDGLAQAWLAAWDRCRRRHRPRGCADARAAPRATYPPFPGASPRPAPRPAARARAATRCRRPARARARPCPHGQAAALRSLWVANSSLPHPSPLLAAPRSVLTHDQRTLSAPAASLRSKDPRALRSSREPVYVGRRASSVRNRPR